jgi:hypothetical protein
VGPTGFQPAFGGISGLSEVNKGGRLTCETHERRSLPKRRG